MKKGFARLALGASVFAASVLLGSCSESPPPAPELDITPHNPSVSVGGSLQFSALNAQGAVSWTS
ncbi:MAG: hypothetical protein ABJB74_05300, partial [Gemmatimonas sp.]